MTTLDIIQDCGVIAIVRLDDLSHAVALSRALIAGGVRAFEFTLTNPEATMTIARVRAEVQEINAGQATIGAGSVITDEQTRAVIEAGAQFVVSPVTAHPVIARCKQHQIPVIPGAYTPTEIQIAWEAGASVVKVFPARSLGPAFIKDVLAPLPHLRLAPTGGINLDNIGAYIKSGVVAVGVGSNLVSPAAIKAGDWDQISDTAAAYVKAVQMARHGRT